MLKIRFQVVLVYFLNLFSLQDPLYPNSMPVSNLSYDFVYLCAEFIMGVHGKINHDVS